jgi:hypothetical protein
MVDKKSVRVSGAHGVLDVIGARGIGYGTCLRCRLTRWCERVGCTSTCVAACSISDSGRDGSDQDGELRNESTTWGETDSDGACVSRIEAVV